MTPPSGNSDLNLGRWQGRALIIGLLAAAVCVLGALLDLQQFLRSYLMGFLYWWVVTMGCFGLAVLYQMTGGRWGYAARPFFDSGIRTLPLVALAFLPLAFGLDYVYEWTEPGYFSDDPHGHNRNWYLSPPFFLGRAAGYFLVCLAIGLFLTVGAVRSNGTMVTHRWPKAGGFSAVLMLLIVTFAAFDWGMSLDPAWFSTIYGALFAIGGILSALCFASAGLALTVDRLGATDEPTRTVLHDLGKLLLAFLMVWAYLEFSQFMIIYAGNLPLEVVWYTRRLNDGWQWVALIIVVLHFAVPFLILLSRDVKRHPRQLAKIAIGLALIHLVDVYWTIIPSVRETGAVPHWLDLAVPVALGGLWLAEYLRQLKHRLLPILHHWPIAPETSHG